jgi:hypothetical protein
MKQMQLSLETNNMKQYKMNKLVQSQISDTWINKLVPWWHGRHLLHCVSLHHQGYVHKRTYNKTSSPKQQGSNTPRAHESSASLNVNLLTTRQSKSITRHPNPIQLHREVHFSFSSS